MTTIAFDPTTFRALFKAFTSAGDYPDVVLQLFFDTATAYVSADIIPSAPCYGGLNLAQQTLALNQMTAHLVALNDLIAAGENPGVEVSSTVDKISVSMMPPPATTQWQWWLNQTPYGAQLLALLSVAAVGGFYSGGHRIASAFRR